MNNGTPLLLDTHCWFWMKVGKLEEFTKRGLAAIQTASDAGMLLVSVMSVWEIGMLEAKGRINLAMPCEGWVEAALATPGLSLAPLTTDIALDSTRLPGNIHEDPVDRILVATARRIGATFLTRDKSILAYGQQHYVNVLHA